MERPSGLQDGVLSDILVVADDAESAECVHEAVLGAEVPPSSVHVVTSGQLAAFPAASLAFVVLTEDPRSLAPVRALLARDATLPIIVIAPLQNAEAIVRQAMRSGVFGVAESPISVGQMHALLAEARAEYDAHAAVL